MGPGRFLLGLAFIVVGTVTLMASLGYTTYAFLERLFDFWPVLLIFFGLILIWGGSIPRWVALLIVAAVLVGVIALALNYTGPFYGPGPFALNDLIRARCTPGCGLL